MPRTNQYAGGGEYFVTLCAHRDFFRAAGGRPFHIPGARALIGHVWESVEAGFMPAPTGRHKAFPYTIMPDHFHGLIGLPAGVALGDFIGEFKSRVVHEWIAGVKRGKLPEFPGKIWQRNYFEKIVRSEEERAAIEKYIRLNPVRLVFKGTHEGCPYAAFGNPNLLEMKKLGVLASGEGAKEIPPLRDGWAWMSGFHSGQEQAVLAKTDAPAIRVAAVAPKKIGLTDDELMRLAEGRLLVMCPFEAEQTTRENALKRNRLVAEWCDKLWIPSARKGGSLEELRNECSNKLVR
jgi:hypothetical protein